MLYFKLVVLYDEEKISSYFNALLRSNAGLTLLNLPCIRHTYLKKILPAGITLIIKAITLKEDFLECLCLVLLGVVNVSLFQKRK